jgi:ubiquinol-cytochrome c reductase cytochrome c1 subunit
MPDTSRSRLQAALFVLLAGIAGVASGNEGKASFHEWHAGTDINSTASLQRGARNFVNYCLGCHSLQYMRYNRLAADLKISEEQLQANLMFTGTRPVDTIVSAMPPKSAEEWFGKAPPDLSLIARSRGVDHLYQFLKTFYVDESRPAGVNNLVVENVAMPHVLADLQGTQKAVFNVEIHEEKGADGKTTQTQVKVFDHFEPVGKGRLTPEEYDAFVRDTVNFLDYVGEPVRPLRERLGIWVVAFLLVFTGFAFALKKEIWKDVR